MAELIDRKELLALLDKPEMFGFIDTYDIMSLPTVKAEIVVHGEWINTRTMLDAGEIYCSVCKGKALSERGTYRHIYSEYCPHCGAKMDGGAEK